MGLGYSIIAVEHSLDHLHHCLAHRSLASLIGAWICSYTNVSEGSGRVEAGFDFVDVSNYQQRATNFLLLKFMEFIRAENLL